MTEQAKNEAPNPIVSIISGGVAGIVTDIVYFPMDTIKTRIQASVQVGKDFSKSAKGKGIFAGISAQMIISFPSCALYWLTYETSKHGLEQRMGDNLNPNVINFMGGAIAELVVNTIRTPFEVLKQQMQIGLDDSLVATAKNIVELKGVRGLYAGFSSLILREIPFSGIQLMTYEICKGYSSRMLETKEDGELGFLNHAINGSISGFTASIFTSPNDCIKTYLMTDRQNKTNLSIKEGIKLIYKEAGIAGFFRAWHIRAFNIAFCSIFFFSGYEMTKKYCQKYFQAPAQDK